MLVSIPQAVWDHMWPKKKSPRRILSRRFQYRKRYEITCDNAKKAASIESFSVSIPQAVWDHMWLSHMIDAILDDKFQYRKRYEITCDHEAHQRNQDPQGRFNTASGMRSHVTLGRREAERLLAAFQYRKRYEITCDSTFEVRVFRGWRVSIPQAVWDHMWLVDENGKWVKGSSFNTASGMRSHVTRIR